MEDKRLEAFKRLLDIMDELRQKCPWDSTQTIDSLRYLTIEETYELSDAIIEKDYNDLKKELGDLLLHIVFYSKIASEDNHFDITDVANGICEKLILRHPHIFGNEHAATAEDVRNNWEKIKLKKEGNRSVLGGVPSALPAMVKAYRIQEKARGVGFDWHNTEEVWNKDEFGDVLFALINYARFIKVNPEDALEKTNRKFIKRFQYIEQKAKESGRFIGDLTLDEMEIFWQEAKKL